MQHTRNSVQVAGGVADDLHDARQHTITHCNTPQHTAAQYSTMQHNTVHCNTPATPYKLPVVLPTIFTTHGSALQHTTEHCSTIQHTEAHCSTLQYTCNAVQVASGVADDLHDARERTTTHCKHYRTLQHNTVHCSTLQLNATHCSTLQRRTRCQWCCHRSPQQTATHCNTLQHTTTHYNSLQPTATHCNTLQHTWNAAQVASGVAVDLHDFPAF